MNEFRFYELTDIHTESVNADLKPEEHKKAVERAAVFETVIDYILADSETDTVVISGDNANHGRYEEHREFADRVQRLIDGGKKVYCITATHDFGLAAVDPSGESEKREGVAQRSELPGMYKNLGINHAIAKFDDYSYVVRPCDGFRLFCLNDDGDGKRYRGYSEEQFRWIEEQVRECFEAGDYPVATTHHPVISPSPAYELMSPRDMIGDHKKTAAFFADIGIKYVFTGHTHMHSIRSITTEKGNKLYDINTGTLSEFPLKFRKVVIKNGEADIRTVPVPEVPFDTNGKTANEYYKDLFDRRLLGAIDGLENDYEYFIDQAGSLAIKRAVLEKYKPLLRFAGKILNHISLKGVGRLLMCPGSVDSEIGDMKFKNLLASILSNVYAGDEPYGPGTPEHKAIMAYLRRLKPILKKFVGKKDYEDFLKLAESIIYDPTPDSDAHIV